MSKYDPLRDYLRNLAKSGQVKVTLSFGELEEILGFPLCAAAHHHRPWWGNENERHPQAKAWLDAGWKVVTADLQSKKITFQRIE